MSGASAAQSPRRHAATVTWSLVDFLVAADSETGVTVYASANLSSKQGRGEQHLDEASVDPVTALQWAGVMRIQLNSVSGAPRLTQLRVFTPLLDDQCSHHWFGIGVEPGGHGTQLSLVFGDSVARRSWRVYAARKDLDTLLATMVGTAPYAGEPKHCWSGIVSDTDYSALQYGCFQSPTVVDEPALTYPVSEEDRCREGRVWLRFAIDTGGLADVSSSEVLMSDSEGFLHQARDGLARARFRAGRINGRPVRTWVVQAFVFRMASCGPVFRVAP